MNDENVIQTNETQGEPTPGDSKEETPNPEDAMMIKYFDILEIKPTARFSEIKSAYLHLKKLYSTHSAVLSPIFEEIPETKRDRLLEDIEEAYRSLKEFHSQKQTEKQQTTRDRVFRKNIPEFEVYSGNALKLTREVLGIELQEIALATGIPHRHLRNIERERFELLPPLGYVRIYVGKFAEYLTLDPTQVTRDYMKVFENKKKKSI